MSVKRTSMQVAPEAAWLVNAVSASGSGLELDRLLAGLINTANTTVYDKAIDAVYLASGTGGSRLHHLVDGNHDLLGAFTAAQAAVPKGSTGAAVLGTAQHLAKDLFSVMGLPVMSVKPETYQVASDWMQRHLGLSRGWQADFMQINGMEVFGGALSIAVVVLGVNRADSASLAEIAVGSGLAGLLGANPLALLAGAVALVAAWKLKKNGESWSPEIRRAAIAAASTGAAVGVGSLLAGTSGGILAVLMPLALSLAAGVLVRGWLLKQAGLGKAIKSPAPLPLPPGCNAAEIGEPGVDLPVTLLARLGLKAMNEVGAAPGQDRDARVWRQHMDSLLGRLRLDDMDATANGIMRRALA